MGRDLFTTFPWQSKWRTPFKNTQCFSADDHRVYLYLSSYRKHWHGYYKLQHPVINPLPAYLALACNRTPFSQGTAMPGCWVNLSTFFKTCSLISSLIVFYVVAALSRSSFLKNLLSCPNSIYLVRDAQ